MFYLVNPGRKSGKKSKRKGRKKPRTAAQKAATKKMLAANRAKKRKGRKVRKSTKKSYSKGVKKMARKSKKGTSKRRRSTRRRKSGALTFRRVTGKVYRSNPGGLKGIAGSVMQGVKDGATVLAGEAIAGLAATYNPIQSVPPVAAKGIAALGLAVLAPRFIGKDTARMLVAGAIASTLREPAKGLPLIGPALSGGDLYFGEYPDAMGEVNEQGEFIGEYAY